MEGMRELLRGALGKSLGGLTPLDRLAAAWPVACGRSLAGRGEVIAYADAVVTIRAADAVWLRQMMSLRAQLTGDLRRIAAVELREIHFELAGEAQRASPGPAANRAGTRPRPGRSRR